MNASDSNVHYYDIIQDIEIHTMQINLCQFIINSNRIVWILIWILIHSIVSKRIWWATERFLWNRDIHRWRAKQMRITTIGDDIATKQCNWRLDMNCRRRWRRFFLFWRNINRKCIRKRFDVITWLIIF